jgi:DNA adenine methylase
LTKKIGKQNGKQNSKKDINGSETENTIAMNAFIGFPKYVFIWAKHKYVVGCCNILLYIIMRYLGGKHKIGEKLTQFMIKQCPPDSVKGYLEPFCGSLGTFKYMTMAGYKVCTGSDIQPDLIKMWQEVKEDTLKIPETITETEYLKLKNDESTKPNSRRAIAGFFLSFGGKYFGGFAQKWEKPDGKDYLKTFKNGIRKIQPCLSKGNVAFENKSYLDWKPANMLIYCDPPYKNTEGYSSNKKEGFDHDLFWETMREWSKNNTVFISEENAPPDFKSVWSHLKKRTLSSGLKNRQVKREYLFIYSGKKQSEKGTNNKSVGKRQTPNKTRKIRGNK